MYTEIKTIEEAFKRHPSQIDLAKVEEVLSFLPKEISSGMLSIMKLQVLGYTLNNNDDPNVPVFEADYNNGSQKKCYSWWIGGDKTGAGFRFGGGGWATANSHAFGGARLALRDAGRVMHAKEYFPDLYKSFYLILE